MPLLLIGNRIINTDHLIRADYDQKATTLALYFVDDGNGLTSGSGTHQSSTNYLMFQRGEALALWAALKNLATSVFPSP